MRVAYLLLVAMLALGSIARAQEEDDDPKAKPPTIQKRAPEKTRPKAEPARSEPKAQAEPKALPKPPAEPKAQAEPKAKPAVAQPEKPKAEPGRKAAVESDEAPPRKPLDETAKKGDKPKALPKLARVTEPAEAAPLASVEAAPAARSVRVRLVDGSTVVGSVRAEQAEALVVDCSLGQLSIPRARISTIAYDAAAGVGSKRAPIQQLDDDVPAPKKRAVAP